MSEVLGHLAGVWGWGVEATFTEFSRLQAPKLGKEPLNFKVECSAPTEVKFPGSWSPQMLEFGRLPEDD